LIRVDAEASRERDMDRISLAFAAGVLASGIVVGVMAWLFHAKTLEGYALTQLSEAEYASAEALVGMGPEENGQVQRGGRGQV
jgi:hypothetical protein